MKFINTFLSIINLSDEISNDNRELIIENYVMKMRKLKKKQKKIMLVCIALYFLRFFVFSIAIIAPVAVDRVNKNVYLLIIIIFMATIIPFIEKSITDLLQLNNKIFVNSQTQLRLEQEGCKIINWKKNERYSNFCTQNEAIDTFLKKVARILQYSVIKKNHSNYTRNDILNGWRNMYLN